MHWQKPDVKRRIQRNVFDTELINYYYCYYKIYLLVFTYVFYEVCIMCHVTSNGRMICEWYVGNGRGLIEVLSDICLEGLGRTEKTSPSVIPFSSGNGWVRANVSGPPYLCSQIIELMDGKDILRTWYVLVSLKVIDYEFREYTGIEKGILIVKE